jgi:type III secretion system low calcium response chaperone LcrH/SycD
MKESNDPLKEYKPAPKVRAQLKRQKAMREALLAGKRGQDLLGFSDHAVEEFLTAARKLFNECKYADAADGFLFLVTLRPQEGEFWMGLGAALQADHSFEDAIDAYEMAAIYDLENPWPYFYLGKCLFAIHDRVSALLAIEMAIEYASESPVYEELLIEAIKAKAVLEHAS